MLILKLPLFLELNTDLNHKKGRSQLSVETHSLMVPPSCLRKYSDLGHTEILQFQI